MNRLKRAWLAWKAPQPDPLPPPVQDRQWHAIRTARNSITDFYRVALEDDIWVSLHYADTNAEIADRQNAELHSTRGGFHAWRAVAFSCPADAAGRELMIGLCETRTSQPIDQVSVGTPLRGSPSMAGHQSGRSVRRNHFQLIVTPSFTFPANHAPLRNGLAS